MNKGNTWRSNTLNVMLAANFIRFFASFQQGRSFTIRCSQATADTDGRESIIRQMRCVVGYAKTREARCLKLMQGDFFKASVCCRWKWRQQCKSQNSQAWAQSSRAQRRLPSVWFAAVLIIALLRLILLSLISGVDEYVHKRNIACQGESQTELDMLRDSVF